MDVLPGGSELPRAPRRDRLSFRDSRPETPTVTSFRFETDGSGFAYRSNQAVRLLLPRPGGVGPLAHTFSLSSSPSEADHIAVTVRMTGSPYKEALRALEPGDPVEVIGPLGDLLYDPRRSAVLVAGGIGIAPFRGMVRYAVDIGAHEPITLLYSARTPEEFAFRAELDAATRVDPNIRVQYSVTRPDHSGTRWHGRTGRVSEPWLREAVEGLERPKAYVVGLPQMVQDTLELLRSRLGVSEGDLEYEYFMGY
jgi:ferredoxin-NADP reductase